MEELHKVIVGMHIVSDSVSEGGARTFNEDMSIEGVDSKERIRILRIEEEDERRDR